MGGSRGLRGTRREPDTDLRIQGVTRGAEGVRAALSRNVGRGRVPSEDAMCEPSHLLPELLDPRPTAGAEARPGEL